MSSPQAINLKDYQVPPYLIDEIALTVDLNDEATLVTATMTIYKNPNSQQLVDKLILNGDELELISIKLNGVVLSADQYALSKDYLLIEKVPEHFILETVTKIYPQKNTALSGLYRSQNTYCTQCEAEGFRRITFYLDHPDVLARYTTTITADKSFPYLLSNGNLVAEETLPDGRHLAKWVDPFRKPSYLFALVAGDFDLLQDSFTTLSGRIVEIYIYVDKGYGDQAHHAMHCVKEAMKWDEIAFGREYDLDRYMIVAIGDFNMGAMENKGLNIFNTKYILAKPETATDNDYIHILSVIGHEYFHNWSGNRVTCRDWFQLSLKEGLTIFRDQSFTEDLLSRPVMRIHDVRALREAQFPEDAGPLAHPVRPESYIEINNFYTTTIYNKGAEVLRMLQTILGKALFREGMDLYFARFDGKAVTIEDFVQTMEEVSGLDLQQFRLWYSQAGTPVVTVKDDYDANEKTYTLALSQSCPSTPGQPVKQPMHIPIRMGLLGENGTPLALHLDGQEVEHEKVLHLTKVSQNFRFKNVATRPVPSLLRNFSAPVKLNYNYSDYSLRFLGEHDVDLFNRWEAGQVYALRVLSHLIKDYQNENPLSVPAEFLEMVEYNLQHPIDDKLLLAEMLSLPSEKYIGEQMAEIDVNAIHYAREFVAQAIAEKFNDTLHAMYYDNHTPSSQYEFTMKEVGRRQLKNRCLSYLTLLPKNIGIALQQFDDALTCNMTDAEAALHCIANRDIPEREQSLNAFYQAWKDEALVMDKWFDVQATTKLPIALQSVKRLMRHEAFDIKNPNKVYSLIGGFSRRNPVHFHAESGEGYAFLRETVAQLDRLNPQVAARMVNPLTTWKRYDKERQGMMREQLELLLLDKKLSKDVYELVSKSLI